MNNGNLLKKNDSQGGAPKNSGTNWAKILGLSIVLAVVLAILTYGAVQIKKTADLYRNNWAEVQFAVNPATHAIVKMAREKYDAKVASAASEIIVSDEKKPADKLVETIINQIEGPKK